MVTTLRTLTAALLVILAGAAATAHAAPPRSLAELDARTVTWLERTLRVPVPHTPTVVGGKRTMDTCGLGSAYVPDDVWDTGCEGFARHDLIAIRREHAVSLLGSRWNTVDIAAHVYLHERLHTLESLGNIGLEEGVTNALTLQLLPAFCRQVLDWSQWFCMDGGVYDAETRAVLAASARATGTTIGARAARLWVRALWAADGATREAMYAAAWGVR